MEELYKKMIRAGKTTYFVDVKEAKNKSKYITITESKLKEGAQEGEKKFTKKSVIVFDKSAVKLRDALDEALKIIQK